MGSAAGTGDATRNWSAGHSDANNEPLRVLELAGFTLAGRVGVKKKPSSPHARLACMHLLNSSENFVAVRRVTAVIQQVNEI